MRRDGVSPPRDGAALTRRRSKQALDPSAAALIRPLSTFSQGLVAEWVRRHGSPEEDPQKADMWRVCGMMYTSASREKKGTISSIITYNLTAHVRAVRVNLVDTAINRPSDGLDVAKFTCGMCTNHRGHGACVSYSGQLRGSRVVGRGS
jgi:hypothetical protein